MTGQADDTGRDAGAIAAGSGRPVLRILSGGAANGLVSRISGRFEAEAGHVIEGSYGAVGVMRDRVTAGEAVDVLILTRALIDELASDGHVDAATVRDLGSVVTGLAVCRGSPQPVVRDSGSLRATLGAASALYVPDTRASTAGRHVAGVLAALGLDLGDRLREFPNGQTAMAAMAADAAPGALGCTQVTEILNTAGVAYAGDLPPPHGLETVYTAGVAARAAAPGAAARLIAVLADPAEAEARRASGFS